MFMLRHKWETGWQSSLPTNLKNNP